MNDLEHRALSDSVSCWKCNEAIEKSGGWYTGGRNACPCCQLQLQRSVSGQCFSPNGNCPIAAYTKQPYCRGTPHKMRHPERARLMHLWLQDLLQNGHPPVVEFGEENSFTYEDRLKTYFAEALK